MTDTPIAARVLNEPRRTQSAAEGGVPCLSAAASLAELITRSEQDKLERFNAKVREKLDGLKGYPLADPIVCEAIVELMEWAQTPEAQPKPISVRQFIDENACTGHVASDHDPKICARCGTHIDSLRPDDCEF